MPPELDMTTSHVPSDLPTPDHIQKEETVHLQSRNFLELVLAGQSYPDIAPVAPPSYSTYSLSSPKVYLLCKNRLRFCSLRLPLMSIDETFCFLILTPAEKAPLGRVASRDYAEQW